MKKILPNSKSRLTSGDRPRCLATAWVSSRGLASADVPGGLATACASCRLPLPRSFGSRIRTPWVAAFDRVFGYRGKATAPFAPILFHFTTIFGVMQGFFYEN